MDEFTAENGATEVLVHSRAGTADIRSEQHVERPFRDVSVITQHAFLGEARPGPILFSLERGWGFFEF